MPSDIIPAGWSWVAQMNTEYDAEPDRSIDKDACIWLFF